MRPLSGDLLGSFDLVAPPEEAHQPFSLENRTEQLFSREHLHVVFSNPTLLLRFTAFLSTHRPESVPLLIHYLDALKALRAIKYSNAVAEALSPIRGHSFTTPPVQATTNPALEERAAEAFDALVDNDLPAYITHMYIQIVSLSISQRITGALAPHLREASEGLAECFVVTDVTRPDNPIVFASEGMSWRMTQVEFVANVQRRIQSHNPIRHELCNRSQLPVPAGSKDKCLERPQNPRCHRDWTRAL